MAFQRNFNELLDEILINYKNSLSVDIPEGSVLFVKAACTASMFWGLYQALSRAADQFFVTTADRQHLECHAAEYNIPTVGRPNMQIVDDILTAKRSKLAGGNRYDYVAWAREVTLGDEYITHAQLVPLARGEGTFDIIVVGSGNDGRASDDICAKIYEHIQEHRPIGSGFSDGMRVCAAEPEYITVTIHGAGANWNQVATREAITAYISTLRPRETLYISQLTSIIHQYGATTAQVLAPSVDSSPPESVVEGQYSMYRAANVIAGGV